MSHAVWVAVFLILLLSGGIMEPFKITGVDTTGLENFDLLDISVDEDLAFIGISCCICACAWYRHLLRHHETFCWSISANLICKYLIIYSCSMIGELICANFLKTIFTFFRNSSKLSSHFSEYWSVVMSYCYILNSAVEGIREDDLQINFIGNVE